MNRFIRCSLIAGLCLSVIGFGTAIAARASGGNWEQLTFKNHPPAIWEEYDERRRHLQQEITIVEETADENMVLFPMVNELRLYLSACEFSITEGDTEGILFSCESYSQMKDIISFYQDEDELSIYAEKKDSRTPRISLTVPFGCTFSEVTVDLAEGSGVIEHVSTPEIQIRLANGQLTIQNTTAYEMELQCAGGSIFYGGTILEDAQIQCAAGEVLLDLEQAKNNFNYEIEAGIGEIVIGSDNFAGLACKKEIVNHAEQTMELHCAAGRIQVLFNEE